MHRGRPLMDDNVVPAPSRGFSYPWYCGEDFFVPSISAVAPLWTNAVTGCCNALAPFCGLLDHLIGADEHRERDGEAKCLCSFEVYHELVFRRLLERQFTRFLAPQDAV